MTHPNIKNGVNIIKKYTNTLSTKPGIYKMIDKNQEIMYIGKAKNLNKRITQYSNFNNLPYRLQKMVSLLHSIETLFTKSENEALILEASLIKSIQPKYNICLKDDKSFVHILLDTQHKFPKIIKLRGKKSNNQISLGPFLSINKLNIVIKELQKLFLVRNCSNYDFATRKKPCLLYQIQLCSAPCVNKISEEVYSQSVRQLKDFLVGRTKQIHINLIKDMEDFSNKFMYEKAAKVRDKIKLLNSIQKVDTIYEGPNNNIDVFSYHEQTLLQKYCIQVYFIRNGCHFGDKYYYFDKDTSELKKEIIYKFISEFYQKNVLPSEIWHNIQEINPKLILKIIGCTTLQQIQVKFLKASNNSKIPQLIINNIKSSFEKNSQNYFMNINVLKDLANKFNLSYIPEIIEVYDNSHHHGSSPIGCVVVVGQNGFIKSKYRKYKMANECCMDDYFMLKEVIRRRFKNINYHELPDLIIIDGGKGQLSIVTNELRRLNISQINVIAMSKGINRNEGREFFHHKNQQSFQMSKNDKTLLFLQNIRDEAHRFVLAVHRNSMKECLTKSYLDSIKGIGKKRKKSLLLHFETINDIKFANEADLIKIKNINKKLARSILQQIHYFNNQ